jgi:hypothetical protein
VTRSPATLLDRLGDRSTRTRALEVALVAHALLDWAGVTAVCRDLVVSAELTVVLAVIGEDPAAARAALVRSIRLAVDFVAHLPARRSEPYWYRVVRRHRLSVRGALRLAHEATRVSVGELAIIGTRHQIVALLAHELATRHTVPRRTLTHVEPRGRRRVA